MYKYFSFLLILFFVQQINAQSQQPEVMFIIHNNGDSIQTSKIFAGQTNEDQVTFLQNGQPTTYQANEILSYFKKSRKYKIYIADENQHKLARIIVRGEYKLAQSFTAAGEEKFYLFANKKWINLDPHADNLIDFLPTVLPDFKEGVTFTKIFYNSPSLGKAISRYNQFKNDDYTVMGIPGYTKKTQLGFVASLNNSSLEAVNFLNDFDRANGFNLGMDFKVQFNRIIGIKLQLAYASTSWRNSELSVKLNTLNFTPMISATFFRPSRKFGLSAAAGLNFIQDLNSEVDDLTTFRFGETTGLSAINLGYDLQLAAHIGRSVELFFSYQINPSITTPKSGLLGSTFFDLKVNTIRAGLVYYFKTW